MAKKLADKFREMQINAFQCVCFEDCSLRVAARIIRTAMRFYLQSKNYLSKEELLSEEEQAHWSTIQTMALQLLSDAADEMPGRLIEANVEGNGINAVLTISELCSEVFAILQEEEIAQKAIEESHTSLEITSDMSELLELASY